MNKSTSWFFSFLLIFGLIQSSATHAGLWSMWARLKAALSFAFQSKKEHSDPSLNEIQQFVDSFCSTLQIHGITCKTVNHDIALALHRLLACQPERFPSGDITAALNVLSDNVYYRAYTTAQVFNRELSGNLTENQITQLAHAEQTVILRISSALTHQIHTIAEIPSSLLISASDEALQNRLRQAILNTNKQTPPSQNPNYNPNYDSMNTHRYF